MAMATSGAGRGDCSARGGQRVVEVSIAREAFEDRVVAQAIAVVAQAPRQTTREAAALIELTNDPQTGIAGERSGIGLDNEIAIGETIERQLNDILSGHTAS
jgi:hypothetical protein